MLTYQEQTTRNRLNQRNFRSRRRQYTQELEEKVRRYEQNGVRATQQIQDAARNVAVENLFLRAMVKDRLGFTDDEMNQYLEDSHGRANSSSDSSELKTHVYDRVAHRLQGSSGGIQDPCRKHDLQHQKPDAAGAPACRSLTRDSNTLSETTSYEQRTLHDVDQKVLEPEPAPTRPLEPGVSKPETSDIESPTVARSPARSAFGGLSDPLDEAGDHLSCEAAASIIAGIRLQDSNASIRQELGCRTSNTCHVSNAALFQIMNVSI